MALLFDHTGRPLEPRNFHNNPPDPTGFFGNGQGGAPPVFSITAKAKVKIKQAKMEELKLEDDARREYTKLNAAKVKSEEIKKHRSALELEASVKVKWDQAHRKADERRMIATTERRLKLERSVAERLEKAQKAISVHTAKVDAGEKASGKDSALWGRLKSLESKRNLIAAFFPQMQQMMGFYEMARKQGWIEKMTKGRLGARSEDEYRESAMMGVKGQRSHEIAMRRRAVYAEAEQKGWDKKQLQKALQEDLDEILGDWAKDKVEKEFGGALGTAGKARGGGHGGEVDLSDESIEKLSVSLSESISESMAASLGKMKIVAKAKVRVGGANVPALAGDAPVSLGAGAGGDVYLPYFKAMTSTLIGVRREMKAWSKAGSFSKESADVWKDFRTSAIGYYTVGKDLAKLQTDDIKDRRERAELQTRGLGDPNAAAGPVGGQAKEEPKKEEEGEGLSVTDFLGRGAWNKAKTLGRNLLGRARTFGSRAWGAARRGGSRLLSGAFRAGKGILGRGAGMASRFGGALARGASGLGGRLASGAGSMLRGGSTLMRGAGGFAAKAIPPVMIAKAAYDALSGGLNNETVKSTMTAGGYDVGKDGPDASQRVYSGAANMLSGVTLGLISPEDIASTASTFGKLDLTGGVRREKLKQGILANNAGGFESGLAAKMGVKSGNVKDIAAAIEKRRKGLEAGPANLSEERKRLVESQATQKEYMRSQVFGNTSGVVGMSADMLKQQQVLASKEAAAAAKPAAATTGANSPSAIAAAQKKAAVDAAKATESTDEKAKAKKGEPIEIKTPDGKDFLPVEVANVEKLAAAIGAAVAAAMPKGGGGGDDKSKGTIGDASQKIKAQQAAGGQRPASGGGGGGGQGAGKGIQITPDMTEAEKLTLLSNQHESGGNAGSVSSGKGDAGGASYGLYQMASNYGVPDKFVQGTKWAKQFEGLKSGSKEFSDKWKEIASGADAGDFKKAQLDYGKKTYYDPNMAKLQKAGFDMTGRSLAVKNALMHTFIATGGSGMAKRVLGGLDMSKASEKDILKAIYDDSQRVDENGKSKMFGKNSPKIAKNAMANWERERADAYKMLEDEQAGRLTGNRTGPAGVAPAATGGGGAAMTAGGAAPAATGGGGAAMTAGGAAPAAAGGGGGGYAAPAAGGGGPMPVGNTSDQLTRAKQLAQEKFGGKKFEEIYSDKYMSATNLKALRNMDPNMLARLRMAAEKHFASTGEKLKITSSFRSYEDQKRIKEEAIAKGRGNYAASAGKSAHEGSNAFDIDPKQLEALEKSGALGEAGFYRPMYGKDRNVYGVDEPWHVESSETKGMQNGDRVKYNIARNQSYSAQAAWASWGPGGPPPGTPPGTPKPGTPLSPFGSKPSVTGGTMSGAAAAGVRQGAAGGGTAKPTGAPVITPFGSPVGAPSNARTAAGRNLAFGGGAAGPTATGGTMSGAAASGIRQGAMQSASAQNPPQAAPVGGGTQGTPPAPAPGQLGSDSSSPLGATPQASSKRGGGKSGGGGRTGGGGNPNPSPMRRFGIDNLDLGFINLMSFDV